MLSRTDLLILLAALPEIGTIFPDAEVPTARVQGGLSYADLGLLFPAVPPSTWRVTVRRLEQEQCLHLRQSGEKRLFRIAHEGRVRARSLWANSALRVPRDRWTLALLTPLTDHKPDWQEVARALGQEGWAALSRTIWVLPEWRIHQELRGTVAAWGVRLECVPVRPSEVWPETWQGRGALTPSPPRTWRNMHTVSERLRTLLDDVGGKKDWSSRQSDRLGKNLVLGLSGISATHWVDSLDSRRVSDLQTLISGMQTSLHAFLTRA